MGCDAVLASYRVGDAKYKRVLQLKAGKQPVQAIEAILDGLNEWRIDCDHTVQIANLFAVRMILGAAKFGVRVGSPMLLRDRESTGLTTVLHYGREGPTDTWRVVVGFDPGKVRADPTNETRQITGPFEYAAGAPLGDNRSLGTNSIGIVWRSGSR